MERTLEEILDWNDETEKLRETLINKVNSVKEVVIFGAGIGGEQTFKILEKAGCSQKVIAFSDNSEDKLKYLYMGLPVIKADNISKENVLILISSTAYNLILEQLVNLGIHKNNIHYFQPAGLSLDKDESLYIKEHINDFEKVYENLSDKKSKEIFIYLLNYRITKKQEWLERLTPFVDKEENQYFDEALLNQYKCGEGAFADGGAYIGDTVFSFYRNLPNWKGNYYGMEASEQTYNRLCENTRDLKTVIPLKIALWSEKAELKFDTSSYGRNGAGSRISDEGERVEADSIDNIFSGVTVDFVKMDIEGAEKKALLGAAGVIQRDRPILAICIYHKREDFFDIPNTIEEIIKDEYDFYIRQYRYGQSETVLYALPKSRMKQGSSGCEECKSTMPPGN